MKRFFLEAVAGRDNSPSVCGPCVSLKWHSHTHKRKEKERFLERETESERPFYFLEREGERGGTNSLSSLGGYILRDKSLFTERDRETGIG